MKIKPQFTLNFLFSKETVRIGRRWAWEKFTVDNLSYFCFLFCTYISDIFDVQFLCIVRTFTLHWYTLLPAPSPHPKCEKSLFYLRTAWKARKQIWMFNQFHYFFVFFEQSFSTLNRCKCKAEKFIFITIKLTFEISAQTTKCGAGDLQQHDSYNNKIFMMTINTKKCARCTRKKHEQK